MAHKVGGEELLGDSQRRSDTRNLVLWKSETKRQVDIETQGLTVDATSRLKG